MENSDGSDLLLGAPARDACAGDTQGRAHASERPPRPAQNMRRRRLPCHCRFKRKLSLDLGRGGRRPPARPSRDPVTS